MVAVTGRGPVCCMDQNYGSQERRLQIDEILVNEIFAISQRLYKLEGIRNGYTRQELTLQPITEITSWYKERWRNHVLGQNTQAGYKL